MKIVHISNGWEKWNGAANIARMIIDEQKSDGHCVEVRRWANRKDLREADEVWIHCGWTPCLWWANLWAKKAIRMPEACYDPVRLQFHGWKKFLVKPIERWALRRCVRIVATCDAEKRWIEEYVGKGCPPVAVTDIKRFFDLSTTTYESSSSDKALHLLFLGRRHPLKGLEYLEGALADIRGVKFRAVSNAFGDEKEKVWRWCDVLILPTLTENFGLVIAEALERGKRVITTDGAPAWGDGNDYGGRLIYLRGYLAGSREERIALLKKAIEKVCE